MSLYSPPHWSGLKLPAQTGSLRLTGPIPLNIANQIVVAAPERIGLEINEKSKFIYPVALICRRMDFETLRLQAAYQKEKSSQPSLRDPSHFVLRVKTPDGALHETVVADLMKAPGTVAPKSESPFELDTDYAYQGVTVSDWEIERARIGAQATTREALFDLSIYFPAVVFGAGAYEVQIETLELTSNWATTLVQSSDA